MIKAKKMSSGLRNTRNITGTRPASFYLDDSELSNNNITGEYKNVK